MNNLSRERFTCYVLPETLKRIKAASKGRPIGYALDDAFADPVAKPVPTAVYTRVGPPHPISCPCDACTIARLNSPQVKKSK